MQTPCEHLRTRRQALAIFAGAACGAATAAPLPVVTILGDSITAGLGLPAAQALPAQLQLALAKLGVQATVRGAGVSGDTTAGGLARVGFSVQADTALCIVALGGNDLLQGVPPADTKANLLNIVDKLKARRVKVLLAGLKAPPTIGAGYARDFNAVFPAVAKAKHVSLYPDLRAGVGQNPALSQRDGLHPNAAGAAVIAARLAPVVARALRSPR